MCWVQLFSVSRFRFGRGSSLPSGNPGFWLSLSLCQASAQSPSWAGGDGQTPWLILFWSSKCLPLLPSWGGKKWRPMAVWGKEWRGALELLVFSLDCFLSFTPWVWMAETFYLEENYFCAQLSVLPEKLWLPYKRGLPVSLCPRLGRPPGQ